MDSGTFQERYPEFDSEPDLVEKALAEAALNIDQTVFGARYDEAHGALAAHKLWSSAFGVSLRLDGSGGERSKYLDHFESIKTASTVALTMMVI